jgi:hypothetical protein
MTITFLRVRPAEVLAEPTANSRRREGTTTVEMTSPTAVDIAAGHEGGVLVVSESLGDAVPAAWVVKPEDAMRLAAEGVAPWRITVLGEGRRESILDALARSGARYLRSTRSEAPEMAGLAGLPGIETSVSVFVDDVTQAVKAVEMGATDLLLRDWAPEGIGELREALAGRTLVERTVFPPGIEIDEARQALPADAFKAWLGQVDGSGAARPRHEWAPGKDMPPPVPQRRFSAEWLDRSWETGSAPAYPGSAGELGPILERSLEGTPPSREEVEDLFRARGDQVDAIAHVADILRERTVGDTVTYVVNRNINYTNLCYFRCGFCAFSKGPRSLNLRGEPYLMGLDEIVERAVEAWDRGATEVTLQASTPTSPATSTSTWCARSRRNYPTCISTGSPLSRSGKEPRPWASRCGASSRS